MQNAWQWLASPAGQAALATARQAAPSGDVLQLRRYWTQDQAAVLADQLQGERKAAHKLPTWHAAGCLLPPAAVEQATNEALVALLPPCSQAQAIPLAADLTCGLGVDAGRLARYADQVEAVEADAALAWIAAYNFERLGLKNLTVRYAKAEQALEPPRALCPAYGFLDPSRRTAQGQRLHALEATQPPLPALFPSLQQCAARVELKASPLLDWRGVPAALPGPSQVFVTALGPEVKEVRLLWDTTAPAAEPTLHALGQQYGKRFHLAGVPSAMAEPPFTLAGTYAYLPHAAIRKAGLGALLPQYVPALTGSTRADGLWFAETAELAFPGEGFQLLECLAYKPRSLKRHFKAKGIRAAEITALQFPERAPQLRERLALKDQGPLRLVFTTDRRGARWCYVLAPLRGGSS